MKIHLAKTVFSIWEMVFRNSIAVWENGPLPINILKRYILENEAYNFACF